MHSLGKWEEDWFNPERVTTRTLERRNSVGVEVCLGGVTQGSPGSAGATLIPYPKLFIAERSVPGKRSAARL
jgi:hypothetical protein